MTIATKPKRNHTQPQPLRETAMDIVTKSSKATSKKGTDPSTTGPTTTPLNLVNPRGTPQTRTPS